MEEFNEGGKTNGFVQVEDCEKNPKKPRLVKIEGMENEKENEEETLYGVLYRLFSTIFFPDPNIDPPPPPRLMQRIKFSFHENGHSLREASRNSTRNLLLWTRRGSPFRALLVISVGTITLLALTGLLVFMLFFLAATTNAIIISFLVSLAAAGGFLAIFFVSLAAIYVAAISVALFVISTTTISTIIAVLIAAGWVCFLWTVWMAAKKSMDLTKHSLSMTGSALSAYSVARRGH
ncbi:uncharacterized protein LOC143863626 [Tasmannia lanceolata]|uniref:uncharacterized protein LOC143863626 n=1 Tax=Tasmannia lanceolata TaxID=3420 RepID=UPI00406331BD